MSTRNYVALEIGYWEMLAEQAEWQAQHTYNIMAATTDMKAHAPEDLMPEWARHIRGYSQGMKKADAEALLARGREMTIELNKKAAANELV